MRVELCARKADFILLASDKEIYGPEICKKMKISMQRLQNIIYSLRQEGHEIWVISKGTRDDARYYKYVSGPDIRMSTKQRMIALMHERPQTIRSMSEALFVELTTVKSALAKIRKEFKVDAKRGYGNQNYYKITGLIK